MAQPLIGVPAPRYPWQGAKANPNATRGSNPGQGARDQWGVDAKNPNQHGRPQFYTPDPQGLIKFLAGKGFTGVNAGNAGKAGAAFRYWNKAGKLEQGSDIWNHQHGGPPLDHPNGMHGGGKTNPGQAGVGAGLGKQTTTDQHKTVTTTGGSASSILAKILQGMGGGGPPAFNAGKWATSMANQQYDPTIKGLTDQIAQGKASQGPESDQIAKFYAPAITSAQGQGAKDSATSAAISKQVQGAAAGMAAALGLGAGSAANPGTGNALANDQAIQQGGVANMDKIIQQEDAARATNLQGDRANQQVYARNTSDENVAKLASLLTGQQQAKGAATYNYGVQGQKLKSELGTNWLQQQGMRENQAVLAAEAAPDLQAKLLGLKKAGLDIKLAGAAGSRAAAYGKAQIQEIQARTKALRASIGGVNAPSTFDKLSPQQSKSLSDSILSGMSTAHIADPNSAMRYITDSLRSAKYTGNTPGQRTYARNLAHQWALSAGIIGNQKGQYSWNGTTFIKH